MRERGLFPYLHEAKLSIADQLAVEMHRPFDLDEVTVFHAAQARVYHMLLNGENVALSAPTSFGKSRIVDAVIADGHHQKLAVIVPTIALIDETRRRLFDRFGTTYKIITHVGQKSDGPTIYVLTPERVPEAAGIEDITFFAIDEFYKLDPELEPERSEAINEALYRLHARGAQFYLLGPNITNLPAAFTNGYSCRFVYTDYATVATEVIRVESTPETRTDELKRLVGDLISAGEPTLIYCGSPDSARTVASDLARSLESRPSAGVMDAVRWISANYHPDWGFVDALRKGIGLHHGPMPRALQQFVARAFNARQLHTLVCTSTLIEGVNTTAKNVVIYDSTIGGRPLNYFTYQNIKGRSGRMGKHFIGRVYTFSDPPVPKQLNVDVPVATQGTSAPDSLLLQLAPSDLSDEARARLAEYYDQDRLPIFVLQQNRGINPSAQLRLADHIRENGDSLWTLLSWRTATPNREQIDLACTLIWDFLLPNRKPKGARTVGQLAFLVRRFTAVPDIRELIEAELESQIRRFSEAGATNSAALSDKDEQQSEVPEPDPNLAVETTLDFLRSWANYHFPRYLMAVSRIQEFVYRDLDLPPGDYSAFAQQIENYFLPVGIAALDEYGIPLQIGKKIRSMLGNASNLDETLAMLRTVDFDQVELSAFERELVTDAMRYI
jgi:hypothetical protein